MDSKRCCGRLLGMVTMKGLEFDGSGDVRSVLNIDGGS